MKQATLWIPALILSLAVPAFAQTPPREADVKSGGSGAESTVKLMINGWANLAYAGNSGEISEASQWSTPPVPDTANNNGHSGMLGSVSLRFQATLGEKVDVVVELRTAQTNGLDGLNGTRYIGGPDSSTAADAINVRQGFVQFAELLPNALIKFGIQNAKFDIRGRGNVLFLDTEHAKSAFGSSVSGTFSPTGGITRVWPETLRQEQAPAGLVVDWNHEKLHAELGLLPDVNAGSGSAGGSHTIGAAEQLYYIDGIFDIDDHGSRIGAIAALMHAGATKGSMVYTFGGGITYKGLVHKGSELFAEGYIQAGKVQDDSSLSPGSIDAKGFCFTGGGRVDFSETQGQPWVETSFLYVSGSDGDKNGDGVLDADVTQQKRFFHYEGNDDLLILEDHIIGLNIDYNYWVVRGKGGLSFSTGTAVKDNLKVEGKVAYARTAQDIFVGATSQNALGVETDLGVTYIINKNVSLFAVGAWLTGANVLQMFTIESDSRAYAGKVGVTVSY